MPSQLKIFPVRMSDELRGRLERRAIRDHRSMNNLIVYLLEQVLIEERSGQEAKDSQHDSQAHPLND
jgi:hypothetical protein